MRFIAEPIELDLIHSFQIARSSDTKKQNVLVSLTDSGMVGVGEAAPSAYYGESQSGVVDALRPAYEILSEDPLNMERLDRKICATVPNSAAARAALDIALHDLVAQKLRIPLYRYFGLHSDDTPLTSFTIGIDSLDIIRRKTREASQYPILKVKLGAGNDLDIVKTIRLESDAVIRIDANAGWTVPQATALIPKLADLGVELIEQPLPAEDYDGLRRLRINSPLPIFADESVKTAADVPRLAGCVDGVNIKLMKTGGLREALRLIHCARAHDMQVMLGCMIETSVAVTAAAHLSPLADYADLDGNLLIANDPYIGVGVEDGKLVLPDSPGLGIRETDDRAQCTRPGEEL